MKVFSTPSNWVCGLTAVAMTLGAAPARAAEQTMELRSGGGYESTRLPKGTTEVELEQQLSGACRFNRSWGYDLSKMELWVNSGCAARFKVMTSGESSESSSGSNTGAAVAAVAAIAGLALIASHASKDRDQSNNNYYPDDNYPQRPYPDRPGGGGWGNQIRGMNNLCLDIEGGLRQGNQLIVFRCAGGNNQRFSFTRNGEVRVGNMCLDVDGGSQNDGARVLAWQCNGGQNQRWMRSGNQIRSQMNGKCLDIRDGNARPGQQVLMWRCNGGQNQRWWW
ncbi:lectin [Roseateles sp.]|uniref:lectin n=1 Tax=Roseateles sp. TaxID=1971397 RepID=UPI003BA4D73D